MTPRDYMRQGYSPDDAEWLCASKASTHAALIRYGVQFPKHRGLARLARRGMLWAGAKLMAIDLRMWRARRGW
jgi:hypothetical protein